MIGPEPESTGSPAHEGGAASQRRRREALEAAGPPLPLARLASCLYGGTAVLVLGVALQGSGLRGLLHRRIVLFALYGSVLALGAMRLRSRSTTRPLPLVPGSMLLVHAVAGFGAALVVALQRFDVARDALWEWGPFAASVALGLGPFLLLVPFLLCRRGGVLMLCALAGWALVYFR